MPDRPQSTRTLRLGYVIGAVVNLLLAWAVNVWPGWEAVPFLTEDAAQVIALVNLSLVFGVAINVAYVFRDPPGLKTLGSAVSLCITMAILVRTLRVYPFEFEKDASLWEPIAEVGLILLIVTTGLALIGQVVRLIRLLMAGRDSAAA